MASPVALALDDVHALRNSECRAVPSVLADHVPTGSRLALARARSAAAADRGSLVVEGRIFALLGRSAAYGAAG